jgi:hypothetical protein
MGGSSVFQNVCRCLCLIAVASSSCRAANSSYSPSRPGDDAQTQEKADSLLHLDLRTPTVTQKIGPQDKLAAGCKFVQVEISRITNPKRYAIQFKLYYLPTNDEKVYLGSFSPFPADNPGKFIVATQGKVRDQGSLILSMVLIDKPEPADEIQVALKKMTCHAE